jgi:hypothetical protein
VHVIDGVVLGGGDGHVKGRHVVIVIFGVRAWRAPPRICANWGWAGGIITIGIRGTLRLKSGIDEGRIFVWA